MINNTCGERLPMFDQSLLVFFTAMFAIISTLASTLNSLVIILYWLSPSLQTNRNRFLMSLAWADEVIGLVVAPVQVYQLVNALHDGYSCKFYKVINNTRAIIAVTGMMATTIALDRYMYITKGARYDHFMRSWKLLVFLAIPWITPFVLMALKLPGEVFQIWSVLAVYCFGWVTLFLSHLGIGRFLRGRSTQVGNGFNTGNTRSLKRTHKMLVRLSSVFVVCTGPFFAYRITVAIAYAGYRMPWLDEYDELLKVISHCAFHISACVNPILYFGTSKEFREAFQKIRSRHRVNSTPPTRT